MPQPASLPVNEMFNERQVAQYSKCYLASGVEEIERFDIAVYLAKFEDRCRATELLVCLREPLCDCASGQCDCDHDETSLVRRCKFDMMSNCMYHFSFTLDHRLYMDPNERKRLQKKLTPKQREELAADGQEECTIRIFHLDPVTQKETPWLDIDKFQNKVVFYQEPVLEFDLDEMPTHHGTDVDFKVNYMLYRLRGQACNAATESSDRHDGDDGAYSP